MSGLKKTGAAGSRERPGNFLKLGFMESPRPVLRWGKGNCCYAVTTRNIKATYLDAPRTQWQLGGLLMHAWYANHTLSPGPPLPLAQPCILSASSTHTLSLLLSSMLCVCVCQCLFYYTALRDSSASEAMLPSHTSTCVSICGPLCIGECVWSTRACSWA